MSCQDGTEPLLSYLFILKHGRCGTNASFHCCLSF